MNKTVNAALYFSRSFKITTDPLPHWCEGLQGGHIVDVATKNGETKYFKVAPYGRKRLTAKDYKYILCDDLIQCSDVTWEFYKNQSDRVTTFVGRALVGREVMYQGNMSTITECREISGSNKFVYTIKYDLRKGGKRLEEDVIVDCLFCN